MYSIESLASPYCYAADMMCRLFGIVNSEKFSIEMVPLIEVVVNSYIMDWPTILSDKMASKILDYRKNRFVTTRIIPQFFMSAYIIDTICFNSEFPYFRLEMDSSKSNSYPHLSQISVEILL